MRTCSLIAQPILALALCTLTLCSGCVSASKPKPAKVEKVHTRYTDFGRYYTDGMVITDDGDVWDYSTDMISDTAPYDHMPVWVGLDDNGTPADNTDDIVLELVFDRNTAIYDELETKLGDVFEIERDGNNIKIKGEK